MLDKAPTGEEMATLIGDDKYYIWLSLCEIITSMYDMESLWGSGGKAWNYEYKYRRGSKTLCSLYAKANCLGFMIIFGKAEREKFETNRSNFSQETQQVYDKATTYHDGKWMMFELEDRNIFEDISKLLLIKRKPNKK